MVFEDYIKFAKFRIHTLNDIKSKRTPKAILHDIDKEMTRICNSIKKGYTLGSIRQDVMNGLYRPYRYFDITWTAINNDRDLSVVITRGTSSITITEENWSKFCMWCNHWNVERPATMEACDDVNYYNRWW
ncbi:hypothetical protein OBP_299 [Pseudomonas phage OBP]|uniref:hypothetical protein n=1 Tax=Pseudomonas phage OBP TaxID=1124849 RepID=UPI000240D646|nr:hypothetical protein OBP_299 [Pseudomonas phage OBP]AEV89736.1 hypothetical protein OBP_299 [Pseudomonas phage OBP]